MDEDADELIPTRTTLLARLKNWQDDSSWQAFFDTYWKLIYGVAKKSGLNDAEAQDVVQETMISVAKHIPAFKYDRSLGTFKAWLFNMTRWRVADQFRRRKLQSRRARFDPDAPPPEPIEAIIDPTSESLDKLWDDEWEKNLLEAATARVKRQLDPKKYQIFDFYVNKEWQAEKVAKLFGVSMDTVYQAKFRATELIRQEIERLKTEME